MTRSNKGCQILQICKEIISSACPSPTPQSIILILFSSSKTSLFFKNVLPGFSQTHYRSFLFFNVSLLFFRLGAWCIYMSLTHTDSLIQIGHFNCDGASGHLGALTLLCSTQSWPFQPHKTCNSKTEYNFSGQQCWSVIEGLDSSSATSFIRAVEKCFEAEN